MVRCLRSRVYIPMSITRSHAASLPEVPNTIQGRWVVTIPATDLHHDLLEPYSCCQLKNGMKRINVPLSTWSTYINRHAGMHLLKCVKVLSELNSFEPPETCNQNIVKSVGRCMKFKCITTRSYLGKHRGFTTIWKANETTPVVCIVQNKSGASPVGPC